MKRKFSRTGYKKNSPDKDKNSNLIPSPKITMKGVDKKVLGLGMDENGMLTGMRFMDPEEDYDFEPASSVFEIPKYQLGGPQPNFFNSPLEMTEAQKKAARGQTNPFDVSGLDLPDFDTIMQPQGTESTTPSPTAPTVAQTQVNPELNNVLEASADEFDFNESAEEQLQFANTLPQNTQLTEAQLKNEANNVLNADSDYNNKSLDAPEKFEFFNPYTGADLESAGVALGQSIESGNTLGTIASGLKIATGLGRNITGGIGQQRRNQFALDEYNDRQREGMTQATYQMGGSALDDQDVQNINNSIDGIDFNPDMVRSLFERVPQTEKPSIYTPNLGKYGEQGYFNVDAVQGDDIVLSTTQKNPHNSSTINQLIPYLREQNPGKNVKVKFQQGGQLEEAEILTGEFSGEDAGMTNAEIETGEYRNDGLGNVTEVKGDTHEQGGVEVNMNPEEKILSDHTKMGADTAKMFKKDFDLEVGAKDTYATVLDKFKKKSGLEKITSEMEELIEKVDKESKKKDSTTKEMNMQFLSKKINELQQQKEPLEKAKEMLFNRVFEIQESKKTPKETTEEGMFKIGGKMYSEKEIMEYGGQFGIEPQRAKELVMKLQEGGFGPQGVAKSLPAGQSQDPNSGFYGGINQQQLSSTMAANPWFDWSGFDPNNPNNVLQFQQEFNRRSQEGKRIKEDGKFGIQTQSVRLPFTSEGQVLLQDDNLNAPLLNKGVPVNQAPTAEQSGSAPVDDKNLGMLLLPDQNPILPSTLQPVLKNERRYGRIDPAMIDPTRELAEIDRSALSANDQLNNLPDAQRQAVLAQIAANTQNAQSQTVAQTNRANQQAQQQADAFNVRQGDREVDAAASDALSYEQRMLQGLSNTENDIRDFFENAQELNMQNFNTVNELNYLNALNDKFQFDGTGFQQIGEAPTREEMLNQIRLAQATTKMKYGGKRKKW